MAGKQPKRIPRPGVDEYGRTPLHYAAAEANASEVSKLLASGADRDAQDDNGWTPLHFAAQSVSSECTEKLLGAGANIRLTDSYGNTALWRAVFCSKGNGAVIKLLRTAGADPLAKNSKGTSPVSLSRTMANFEITQFFSDIPDTNP
jgi:uncharacterized protein